MTRRLTFLLALNLGLIVSGIEVFADELPPPPEKPAIPLNRLPIQPGRLPMQRIQLQPGRVIQIQQGRGVIIQGNLPADVDLRMRQFNTPTNRNSYFVPVLPPPPPLPTRPPIPAARLAALIADLKSDDYQLRMHATRELKAGGKETVAALYAAAGEGSPEVDRRVLAILTTIFLSPDESANRAAEAALEDLRDHGAITLASQIDGVFESHEFLRSGRALQDIEALGGKVIYSKYAAISDAVTGEQRRDVSQIVIPLAWQGGDEGLRYVARIPTLRQLLVIAPNEEGAVSQAGLDRLQLALPNLRIDQRGPAQIGISFLTNETIEAGLLIDGVEPKRAAERAGLKAGDILVKFDEHELESFEHLTTLLKKYAPGDTIKVQVLRFPNGGDRQELTLDVTLDSWED